MRFGFLKQRPRGGGSGGIAPSHLVRNEAGNQWRGKRRAVPPRHPIKGLLGRAFRRLFVGVYASGISVDHAFAQRVNVHPVAVVAKPGQVSLVRPQGADADSPWERGGVEPPFGAVVAGRRDQGDVSMPTAEVAER